MRISPSLKAVIVALPTGAWLVHAQPNLARTLAVVAGAALLALAWIVFMPSRPAPAAAGAGDLDGGRACSEHRPGATEQRMGRTPTSRFARDVRCPVSRATTRARRSARR